MKFWLISLLIVAGLVAAAAGGAFLYFHKSPVEKLQPILAKIEADGTNFPTSYHARLITSSLKYDVRKTDSLTSPLVCDLHWYSCERGTTVTEKGLNPGFWEWKAALAYQDGKWRVTGLQCLSTFPFGMPTPDAEGAEKDWRAALDAAVSAE